ncbi:MAG: lysophospholipid acyltransferase family protein [Acidobacteriota bacterium]
MRKILYYLYQPYKWLVVVPLFGISTVFFGSLAAVLATLVSPKFGSMVSGIGWSRLNAFFTPMFVSVHGREKMDEKQSYVIVANHQSGYDIYVLYGWLGVDFKWVLKQELRKAPGLGVGCEKLGHIYVDRSNTDAAIRSIEKAKERIKDGTSVVFFAEGTRSEDGKLLTFKKGAFRMAIDLGLPVLPISIVGTRHVQPPNTYDVFPGKAKLVIHQPIPIEGYDRSNMMELLKRTRAAIDSGLEDESPNRA